MKNNYIKHKKGKQTFLELYSPMFLENVINVVSPVGSIDDGVKTEGLAHMTEHLFVESIDKNNLGGEEYTNAFTYKEMTVYLYQSYF